MPETTDRITALSTLQFASGGLFDAEPVDDYTVHLVRSNERGGTPGPTLCGIDRFHPDSAGWSVGGGISGPTIVHKPCPGCAEVARREFAGLPVGGLGAAEMTAVLTVLCKHKRCRKPIVRCETLPAHHVRGRLAIPQMWCDNTAMSTLYDCQHHGAQEHTYAEISHFYCGCNGTLHTACRPVPAPYGTPAPANWPIFLTWRTDGPKRAESDLCCTLYDVQCICPAENHWCNCKGCCR